MNYIYKIKRIVMLKERDKFCKLEYPNHKHGCPNFGDRNHEYCPPHSPKFDEYFDTSKPLYLIHSEFDLEAHIKRMKELHPTWSDRQLKCVLYWQGTSKAQLKKRIEEAMKLLDVTTSTFCPEGMGLNVYVTARLSGLFLQKIRHLKLCRHIAIIGNRQEK